ncbi:MAG: folate-binding protein YgfZ [Gemmatimonadota bacterium]
MSDGTADTAGYRALLEGFALREEPRVLFHVFGPGARRVVNGLVTNSVEGVGEGRGVYAFALTAKGRPIAEMRILPPPPPGHGSMVSGDRDPETTEERFWIDIPASAADGFHDLLKRSVPPILARVEVANVRRLSLLGPLAFQRAPSVLEAAGFEWGQVAGGDGLARPLDTLPLRRGSDVVGLLVRREPVELDGIDVYLASELAGELERPITSAVVEAGGAACTAGDWDVRRIEEGLPVFGSEITLDNLPQETGQTERAVSFDKGCYTGQEVVARLHYRGHVNRELRGLRGDANGAGLNPGAELYSAGRVVGAATSVVESPRFGRIGLGYVRTSIEPGTRVFLSDSDPTGIEVIALPFTAT